MMPLSTGRTASDVTAVGYAASDYIPIEEMRKKKIKQNREGRS